MTILIAHATEDSQIILADRRITDMSTGKIIDDWEYKILQYWNSSQDYKFSLAFTGIVKYRNFILTDYFMNILPKVMDRKTDLYYAINYLAEECGNIFKTIPLSQDKKPLTVILCGQYNKFFNNPNLSRYIPFLTIISNHVDKNGRQINIVNETFSSFSARLFRRSASITVCRGNLAAASKYSSEFLQVRRYLRHLLSYHTKINIMKNYIRLVSSFTNNVGKNLLGVAIPKNGITECFDFPEDKNIMTKTIPSFITEDGSRITNFKISPL